MSDPDEDTELETEPTEDIDPWERHSAWWQEQFTEGADPEYVEQILPLAGEWLDGFDRVLEVGTGEGQVARTLSDPAGPSTPSLVVGVDLASAQITEAARRGGGPLFARAGATALPFTQGAFDAVVACLVFEHIDDLDGAITEVARVLRPGGRFVFFLNHPLIQAPDSGWIDDQILDPPEQYWRIGPYLPEAVDDVEVAEGVVIRFLHRPLSRYVNALLANGLTLEQLLEPAPPAGFLARAPEYAEAASIPRLMVLVTRRARSGR